MEVSLDGLPLAEAGKLAWARVQAWGRTHGEANLATLLARFAADRRGALDPAFTQPGSPQEPANSRLATQPHTPRQRRRRRRRQRQRRRQPTRKVAGSATASRLQGALRRATAAQAIVPASGEARGERATEEKAADERDAEAEEAE